jgi:hypothetical protein
MRCPTARLMLAFTALCCAGLAGCVTSSAVSRATPPMALHLDISEMKAEVLRHVAVGTPLDEAKGVMEAHGFKCSYGPYQDWEQSWFGGGTSAGQQEICLVCSKFMPQSGWLNRLFFSEEIKVYFPFEGDKVTEVRVERISTGL